MNSQGATIASWGGHVVDLFRLAKFDIRNPHSLSKFRQIKAMSKRCNATTMIETGTFLGNTAMRCSRVFTHVYTIELDEELYKKSKAYLASRKNVESIQGDALKMLPTVLSRPKVSDALIFLDGHFSSGITAHGDLAEPACEEIEVMADFKDKINGFIVDDFRCFGIDTGFPKKSDLLKAVEDYFPNFEIAIHFDQLLAWKKP